MEIHLKYSTITANIIPNDHNYSNDTGNKRATSHHVGIQRSLPDGNNTIMRICMARMRVGERQCQVVDHFLRLEGDTFQVTAKDGVNRRFVNRAYRVHRWSVQDHIQQNIKHGQFAKDFLSTFNCRCPLAAPSLAAIIIIVLVGEKPGWSLPCRLRVHIACMF